MTTDLVDATDEAQLAAGATPADRLLQRLAQLVGARADVRAVFGDPVRQEAMTVIPVARARWGFGGGAGRARKHRAWRLSGKTWRPRSRWMG